jgi:hypothetical protein
MQVPPIKMADGSWARSEKQKADLFAEHLENTFKPPNGQADNEYLTPIRKIDEVSVLPVTLKEIKQEVKNLKDKKAPGYDLITGQIIKALPEKALRKLQHIINAIFRLSYVPRQWKVAEIIMIPKPNKPLNDKASYMPISLLTTTSKIFERLFLKRLKPIIESRNLIPSHQFGFRERHSTIEQVHRITDTIEEALEKKKVCSAIFLDVAQAFDKVWHHGLEFKLQRDLPKQYFELLKFYINDRYFRVRQEGEYSKLKKILAGVPQGSVLVPVLYLLYTNDLPNIVEARIGTFADDTAVMITDASIVESTRKLQNALNIVNNWTKKWRITLNESKSTHINFTNRKIEYIPVRLNLQQIPYSDNAKYLGMTLDSKLRWKAHVKKKRQELNLKFRKMHWLIGRNSELTTHNKLLLYKQILKPICTYGIQLWGCAKKTTIKIIQTFQNKVLRSIVNALWYIRNDNLHRDLNMECVSTAIQKFARSHVLRLQQHDNEELRNLLDRTNRPKRLKRTMPLELVVP